MAQSKSCEGCSHAHDCTKVYEQLGCAEGPSIAGAVMVAFLVPILVFIGALAGFGRLLEGAADTRYQMPLAAALALAATTGVMLAIRVATRRYRKK
jgi:hypothetical protein